MAAGCGEAEVCADYSCGWEVQATAAVPPISGAWTVTVCMNASCGSGTLTPSKLVTLTGEALAASVELEPRDTGPWRMNISLLSRENGKNGDELSVKVVDSNGSTILTAMKSITYVQYERDSCHTCHEADVKLP